VPVRPGKQRVVLAALLLRANRILSVDDLAEARWGAAPPPTARVTVQNYVKRLRTAGRDRARPDRHHGWPPRVSGPAASLAAGSARAWRR
jgi:DNA-binding SARP family transcriptional activator